MPDSDVSNPEFVAFFESLRRDDVARVGGKNASLGEMIQSLADRGVRVPGGFATTSEAYRTFLEANELKEPIADHLAALEAGDRTLREAGSAIRGLFLDSSAEFPDALREAILAAYRTLSRRYDTEAVDVAARSSATAEDLPEASFAGQQESFLNIRGEEAVMEACRRCFASLFTDRAIMYRREKGFDHMAVALSVGFQKMVRSDRASAGVMFTIDTDTGFPHAVLINGNWGLGETVVQGSVNPDQFTVYKPFLENEERVPIIGRERGSKEQKLIYADGGDAPTSLIETTDEERRAFTLTDDEILQLARWAVTIEDHYDCPMDIEWAKDGDSGDLFIVQARPETVHSQRQPSSLHTYHFKEAPGTPILTGLAIGEAIANGRVSSAHAVDDIESFEEGDILVTGRTDPDWVPIMKKAAAIITDAGGRTSHAAIVSRELGIPAIIGTGNATEMLEDSQAVTVDCATGSTGRVYDGLLEYREEETDLDELPEVDTDIMVNVASPDAARRWWKLPCDGVGLARLEYVINNVIQVHPMALVNFESVEDPAAREKIDRLTAGYDSREEYFVRRLAEGVASIAAVHYPNPVIVRTSDFKTNEYADLVGGAPFEPAEANPMLGWRGASRYYDEGYREGFALECQALRRVREEMGFDNVVVMLPFVRTVDEADRCLQVMAEEGLERGREGLKVYMMAEVPSNVVLADTFAERFDGFSIGSNDLTQLTLGVDRDSVDLAELFDERDPAVEGLIAELIERAHAKGRPVGICGQGPSDYPEFAAFLVEHGIDSMSLNPDSIVSILRRLAD
jgi:pyruvate,water dikinase